MHRLFESVYIRATLVGSSPFLRSHVNVFFKAAFFSKYDDVSFLPGAFKMSIISSSSGSPLVTMPALPPSSRLAVAEPSVLIVKSAENDRIWARLI